MKAKAGVVFSIAGEHEPVPGCTVSEALSAGANPVVVFSLAENTDISAEMHPFEKLIIPAAGRLQVQFGDESREVGAGEAILTPADVPVGIRAEENAVYTEIAVKKEDKMNKRIKAGEVFRLAELVPYQEGRIVNMDLVHSDAMKFVVMAFDEGTGLAEHAAPGEALIFALDGEGVIVYEGEEHRIKAGENFHFAKGGRHAVRADQKFKMALLLTLD